jgi:hypothetical protein
MPDLRPRTSDPQGHSRDASYVVNCYRPARFASFTDRQSLPKENGVDAFSVARLTQIPILTHQPFQRWRSGAGVIAGPYRISDIGKRCSV